MTAALPVKTSRLTRCLPLLEQLARTYPHLFGEVFLPLKRGIYQDLLAAHPETIDPELLKEALAYHTRSTRYLNAVAAGHQRHDLAGAAVEPMAPEHVHHALLEVYRRRTARAPSAPTEVKTGFQTPTPDDLRAKLVNRIAAAIGASGLSRQDYADLVRSKDDNANAILDDALAGLATRAAKDEALHHAYTASGQTIEVFAEMYGMQPRAVAASLARVAA